MTFGRRSALLFGIFLLLVLGYILLGFCSGSVSGEARAFALFPVEADAAVSGSMAGDDAYGDAAGRRAATRGWVGPPGYHLELVGPDPGVPGTVGLFSGSYGSGIKSRTSGSTLNFRYGDEIDLARDVFDALAFEITDGELSYLEARPETRPLVLPVEISEMTGQGAVGVKMDVPPGAYVVSVSASVEEGNARYSFRVIAE